MLSRPMPGQHILIFQTAKSMSKAQDTSLLQTWEEKTSVLLQAFKEGVGCMFRMSGT